MIKFNFPEEAVLQFTCGDCWYLAWELHRLSGFPLRFVRLGRQCDPHYDWCHVVVEVGPDQYMDVLGIMSAEEVASQWGSSHLAAPVDGIDSDWDTYHQWIRECVGGGANRYIPLFGLRSMDPAEMAMDVLDVYTAPEAVAA